MQKYHNKKTVINGVKYDSKKEAYRAQELLMLERAGHISNLANQVRFLICPAVKGIKGSRKRYYVADFVYVENGIKIIEDVKSAITRKNAVYSLKKQLVQYLYCDEQTVFREYV